ncbi:MAG: hypothetical protein KBC91_06245 [Candidatus Omnitrophica bacterium]|nr:hypothetical protein [Candidatus Omnitrophota bacterium]
MHSDHDLEKEIRFILRGSRLQEPPKELLNNFEDQVWDQIIHPRPPLPGLTLAAPILLLVILIAGYAFWLLQPASLPITDSPKSQSAAVAPAPDQTTVSEKIQFDTAPQQMLSSAESEPLITDEVLDSRIRDLLILEWLGETDGLLEDFNLMPAEAAITRTI